jgi:hypothetical protein
MSEMRTEMHVGLHITCINKSTSFIKLPSIKFHENLFNSSCDVNIFVGYLMTLLAPNCIASEGRIADEMEKIWKEAVTPNRDTIPEFAWGD